MQIYVKSPVNKSAISADSLSISDRRLIETSLVLKDTYLAYFGIEISNQDKSWASHIVCNQCSSNLMLWKTGWKEALPFGKPMVWDEPTDHVTNCYCCVIGAQVGRKQFKSYVQYPEFLSAEKPRVPDEDIPIPQLPNLSK